MITTRRSAERGHASHGWLESRHTFSFADYFDPKQIGFRALRVINEDWIRPGTGFGTHPHRDMEIITYVISGAIAHQDSMGNGSTVRPGELQRMSAGTGILHSEHNPSPTETLHLLQIWIQPERRNLPPSYEQQAFPDARGLRLLASRTGPVTVHQDCALWQAVLTPEESVAHELPPGRHGWIQVVSGVVAANGVELGAGDGAAVESEPRLELVARDDARLLLFDLA